MYHTRPLSKLNFNENNDIFQYHSDSDSIHSTDSDLLDQMSTLTPDDSVLPLSMTQIHSKCDSINSTDSDLTDQDSSSASDDSIRPLPPPMPPLSSILKHKCETQLRKITGHFLDYGK